MISQSLNQSIGMLVSAITLFVGLLLMMLITNVIMTLTAVAAIFLGFLLMRLITGRSQNYFSRQQRHLGELNGQIEEIYSGHTVVKAYNGEENAKHTFDEMNGKLRQSAFRAQCLAGLMQPLMIFIGNLGYVAVCVMGAVLTMNHQIGFEVIVAFMYVRFFTQPLSQIARPPRLSSPARRQASVSLNSWRHRRWRMKAAKQPTCPMYRALWNSNT